jgi:hypothetical protein
MAWASIGGCRALLRGAIRTGWSGMRKWFSRTALVVVAVVGGAIALNFGSSASSLPACDRTWVTAGDGAWEEASNWSDATVPGAGEHVCIGADADATYTVTLSSGVSVGGVTVGQPGNVNTQTLVVSFGALAVGEAHLVDGGVLSTTSLGSVSLDGAGATFTQDGGMLVTEEVGDIDVPAGATFAFVDGTNTGTPGVRITNGTLDYSGAALPSGTSGQFVLRGASTLSGDVPAGHVLDVRGAGDCDCGLTSAGGFTNAGTINLTKDGPDGSTILEVTSGTLTNAAGGVLSTSHEWGYGRYIRADHLINDGTIDLGISTSFDRANGILENRGSLSIGSAASGQVTLNLPGDTSPQELRQTSGSITFGANTGSRLDVGPTGKITLVDGEIHESGSPGLHLTAGTLDLQDADLTGTSTRTIHIHGNSNLLGDVPAPVAIDYVGASGCDCTLTAPTDFTNAGTIELDKDNPDGSTSLEVTTGTLTNAASGTISTVFNWGYGRAIRADLVVNHGTLDLDLDLAFDRAGGVLDNRGTVSVGGETTGAVTLSFPTPGVTGQGFVQTSGALTIPSNGSKLAIGPGGTFEFVDGAVSNPASGGVRIDSGTLDLSAAAPTGSSDRVFHINGNSSLLGNIPPVVTVDYLGAFDCECTLSAPTDFTNNGTLILGKDSPGGSSNLSVESGTGALLNNGTLKTDVSWGYARGVLAEVTNNGTIEVDHELTLGGLTNLAGGVLTGGTYDLAAPLVVPGGDAVQVNAATLLLDSSGTFLAAPFGTDGLYDVLHTNQGTLHLRDSRGLSVAGLTNTGTVQVGPASHLSVHDADYDQTGATSRTILERPDNALQVVNGGIIDIADGTLEGAATVWGDVVIGPSGVVKPGASPGTLNVQGNYHQADGAELVIELEPTDETAAWDRLQVSGDAVLEPGAVLRVDSGFTPPVGAHFTFLTTGGDITGFFNIADAIGWDTGVSGVYYRPNQVGTNKLRLTAEQRTVLFQPNALAFVEGTNATFTLQLSFPTEHGATASAGGFLPQTFVQRSATANVDYSAPAPVAIAPLETTVTVTAPVLQDTVDEYDTEDFGISVASFSGNVFAPAGGSGIVRITDDDAAPTASITPAAPAVAEGNSGVTPSPSYTISLSGPSEKAAKVAWGTADGTATVADGDYQASGGTLTFPILTTSLNVVVDVLGDTRNEADETFSVGLSGVDDTVTVVAGPSTSASTTITNDDAVPSLSLGGSGLINEGNAATSVMTFPVHLSTPSGRTVTVQYATSNGTATVTDNDYVTSSGTLTYLPGETVKSFTVSVNGDAKHEGNETFNVTLSAPVHATVASGSGFGIIVNDDAAPTVSVASPAPVAAAEGNSGTRNATFTVTLSAASALPASVNYTTANDTAFDGTDFVRNSGVLLFNPGETSKQVQVLVNGDTTDEPDESFGLALTNAAGATIGTASASTTITNDDTAPVASLLAPAPVLEADQGSNPALVHVVLGGPSGRTVTLPYTVTGGTATNGVDYTFAAGQVVFAPGEVSTILSIPIASDTLDEPDESIVLALGSATNATVGAAGQATVWIADDDLPPTFNFTAGSVVEGNSGTANIPVNGTLSAPSAKAISISVAAVADENASMPADLDSFTGTLSFAPGVTQAALNIPVKGDTFDEADENFGVFASSPMNAALVAGNDRHTATILDDDNTPSVSVANAPAVNEGNTGSTSAVFPITLSAASGLPVTVPYATNNLHLAQSPGDFSATSGTVTFQPGETVKNVTVAVVGDLLHEENETFGFTLSPASNASMGTQNAIGTITNDDAAPSIEVRPPSPVLEGAASTSTPANFKIALSAPAGRTVTANWATAGGTAVAGQDYTAANGTVTFLPGEVVKTVTFNVLGNNTNEPDRTVGVSISNVVNAATSVAGDSALTTITDDDGAPSVSLSGPESIGEGVGMATYTVTLAPTSRKTVTVSVGTIAGSAGETDFQFFPTTLTFAPGQSSKTVSVNLFDDIVDEPDTQGFSVYLASPSNAALGQQVQATTITDNDSSKLLSITPSSPTVEGSSMTFWVNLSGPSEFPVTVDVTTTAAGTATPGSDFTASSAPLSFGLGSPQAQTFAVPTTADAADEADETVVAALSNASNASLDTASATGTIADDDDRPGISVIAPVPAPEGASGTSVAPFEIQLSAPSSNTVKVDYSTANGSATSGSDYTAVSGQATFAPGQQSVVVNVPIAGDATVEADETFSLKLANPLQAGLTVAEASATILNDDTAPPADPSVAADFDGDGDSDVAVYRPSDSSWYSDSGMALTLGTAGDVPVAGDYNGDGKTDPAVYRPSDQTWYVDGRGDWAGIATQWGAPGDVPVPADYDGDGDTDIAVFRPSDASWYVQGGLATQWGIVGDVPIPADFDGDGDADVAVYRPSDQTWYSQGSGLATQWGVTGDIPVPVDFDGDGDADVAVFRPSDQTWYSQGGLITTQWGAPGDLAVAADYDGDGDADVAVFRPAEATWYVQNGLATQFGQAGDEPAVLPRAIRQLYP